MLDNTGRETSELPFMYHRFSILIDITMGLTNNSDGKTRNAYRIFETKSVYKYYGLQVSICSRMRV
jgi:hypothetical protein